MEEIWKDYPRAKGKYQASTRGRIRSLNYHREKRVAILTPIVDIGGYEKVNLRIDGHTISIPVHRIIAETFVENPDGKPYVDHIDTNRRNNCVGNLRWCTTRENHNNPLSLINHGCATEKEWRKGSFESHKKAVLQYTTGGVFVREFESIKRASDFFGKAANNIGVCVRHPQKHHMAYGFLWCYADDTERIKEIESLRAQDSSPKLF